MKKTNLKIIIVITLLILIIICSFLICKYVGNRAEQDNGEKAGDYLLEQETIYIDGKAYLPKKNISTYLFIGIDKLGKMQASEMHTNDDMADFLVLCVFDKDSGECKLVSLNRDTITNVSAIGPYGDSAGTKLQQLAFAYSYGDGMEESCKNTADTVSNLLYGVNIDNYICMTMDVVSSITDYVGGIHITPEEDLTVLDPSFTVGTDVKLNGELALKYVRARKEVSDGTNISRMGRQAQFMKGFFEALRNSGKSANSFASKFVDLSDYVVTDADSSKLTDLYDFATKCDTPEIVIPKGEAKVGKHFMEFYVDEADLKNLVTGLFFDEKQ